MSNSNSSTKEISEEDAQGNTENIKEEDDQGDTENNDEEDDQGDAENNDEEDDQGDAENNDEEDEQGDAENSNKEDDEGNTHEINVEAMKVRANGEGVNKIFELLGSESKIILTGKAGTGKTWIARAIYKRVLKGKHVEPIWICLDQKHDERSLFDTVARQFSLPTSADKNEDNGEDEKRESSKQSSEDGKKEWEDKMKELEDKFEKRLADAAIAGNFLLMVLDGEFDMLTENDQEKEVETENLLKKLLGFEGRRGFKILITRRRSKDGDDSKQSKKVEVEPLLGNDEALKLFSKKVNAPVRRSDGFEELSTAIREKDKLLPAEVLILAGTLNFIAKDTSGDWDLKLAIDAATNDLKAATNDLGQLLGYTYDKEPGKSCLIDCFWHSWQFLGKHGGVHFNELITNWIMEGYIKPTNQIEKAYENGHHILMQLINCYMLRMQEDNVIVVEGATLNMNGYCRRGYSGTADPGLASVLKDCKRTILEGITPADGMMKTLCSDTKEEMISSLLIDGSRLCREVLKTFFEAKCNLNLLAILYPRLESPAEVLPIFEMKEKIVKEQIMEELRVLLLRGAYLLKDVEQIETRKCLTVLEISGSTSVQEIPPGLFHEGSQLRSLKLSALGIESLPESFSELTKLRRLILSKCSYLKQLPKLIKLTKLEVIDLSECTSLEKIQEKSFKILEKLQVINFSHTKIEKLPIIKSLEHLKIVLLKGCTELAGMRTVKQISSLKILDLSGAVSIKEIMYDSFEGANDLRELDLSETKIQFLPSRIGILQKLRLQGCSLLRNLPELGELGTLEELDLSGCTSLRELPDLKALEKLKILGLKDCKQLESLPLAELKSLSKLEKLDLSGTNLWSKEVEESLKHTAIQK